MILAKTKYRSTFDEDHFTVRISIFTKTKICDVRDIKCNCWQNFHYEMNMEVFFLTNTVSLTMDGLSVTMLPRADTFLNWLHVSPNTLFINLMNTDTTKNVFDLVEQNHTLAAWRILTILPVSGHWTWHLATSFEVKLLDCYTVQVLWL